MKPFYTFVLVHLLFLTSICYSQTIWYVSPTGAGSQNGSSWANAATIETALNNAVTNTQIWVKQGNYAISSTLISRPSNLSIYGGFLGSETLLNQRDWQNNITIFDGQGSVKIMRFQSDNGIIDGIHFRNGYVTGVVSGPGATNDGGGALRLTGNNQIIRNCTFSNNTSTAERGAGAIFIWHGEGQLIENCVFENNKHTIPSTISSNGGGAIHNWDNNVTIRNCRFSNNSSTKSGGAIYSWGQNFKIENSSFQNNHSDNSGGAIHLNYYELNIKNSVFTGNSALRKGGAIYNSHIIKITNSLFNRNTTREIGGAIANQQELHVTNSTFAANNNTAISHRTFASDSFSTYLTTIYNSIFYNNTSTVPRLKDVDKDNDGNDQSTKDFRFNIFQENTAGTGNLVGINPLFVNNTNNFRLQPSSPAVNYGNNSLYNQVSGTTAATSTDLANLPRLFEASIDLGAYELQQEPISTPSCTILTLPANNATN
ncbi:choice-of-anchor Q domain-containing protein, partial [Empedobacter brevis]|uniref:choice-of-anchor Q domain-containing protein n=1 Tax=Empedobacter brevis TaxID=247 RepID=UPI002FDF5C0A